MNTKSLVVPPVPSAWETSLTEIVVVSSLRISAPIGLPSILILSAAFDAHKILRRVATYSQSPDHPIIPSIPETEYLKGFVLEVIPSW